MGRSQFNKNQRIKENIFLIQSNVVLVNHCDEILNLILTFPRNLKQDHYEFYRQSVYCVYYADKIDINDRHIPFIKAAREVVKEGEILRLIDPQSKLHNAQCN